MLNKLKLKIHWHFNQNNGRASDISFSNFEDDDVSARKMNRAPSRRYRASIGEGSPDLTRTLSSNSLLSVEEMP